MVVADSPFNVPFVEWGNQETKNTTGAPFNCLLVEWGSQETKNARVPHSTVFWLSGADIRLVAQVRTLVAGGPGTNFGAPGFASVFWTPTWVYHQR